TPHTKHADFMMTEEIKQNHPNYDNELGRFNNWPD
ncbi:nitrate ABC transporter substrate-binding protein, partial [Staphylococcus pseudintermedius]